MKLSGKEFRKLGVIHLKVDQVDLEFQQTNKLVFRCIEGFESGSCFRTCPTTSFFGRCCQCDWDQLKNPNLDQQNLPRDLQNLLEVTEVCRGSQLQSAWTLQKWWGRPGVTLGYLKYLKVLMCNNCWTILYSVPALRTCGCHHPWVSRHRRTVRFCFWNKALRLGISSLITQNIPAKQKHRNMEQWTMRLTKMKVLLSSGFSTKISCHLGGDWSNQGCTALQRQAAGDQKTHRCYVVL